MRINRRNVVVINEFAFEQAYRDMIAREEDRLALQAVYLKNTGFSSGNTLKKLREEFPPHKALSGILEKVVFRVYSRGL